ncbi:hypothetical protein AVEN_146690-1, partial [Araneus ventricosus]
TVSPCSCCPRKSSSELVSDSHPSPDSKDKCLKGFGNLVVGKGKGLSQRFP